MDRPAYNLGVEPALRDAGLVKEAGPMWRAIKRVGRDAWHSIKDYASLKNVRDALRADGTASNTAKRVALRNIGKSLVPYAVPLGLGAAGVGGYYGAKKLFPKAFGD